MDRNATRRIGQADLDAAKAAGIAIGRAEGAAAEHERLVAIVGLPEATNRQASAVALALAGPPVLTVEQCQRILPSIPEDRKPVEQSRPASSKNPFEAAMEHDNPEVGACKVDDPVAAPDRPALRLVRAGSP